LEYALELVRAIRLRYPEISIHSFSAVEIDHWGRETGRPLLEVCRQLKEAGLHSLPGGGAEILVDRVRELMSPKKMTSEAWLAVMRSAHQAGLPSTATMVFGHLESREERILHLLKVRSLQDETRGFRAFIPWSFVPPKTFTWKVRASGGADYLKTVAVSRLMLDNVEHIQSGWLTEEETLGLMALYFGADDMGGTLWEDKVMETVGVRADLKKDDLIRLIRGAGYRPVERNTRYEVLREYP